MSGACHGKGICADNALDGQDLAKLTLNLGLPSTRIRPIVEQDGRLSSECWKSSPEGICAVDHLIARSQLMLDATSQIREHQVTAVLTRRIRAGF